MADKVHVIKKTVRLMPSEASVLAEKSKNAGQKPNDYPEIRKLLKELINEVNRIGVNINQITFHHNVELYSKEDKEQLIAYMRKLNLEVKKVVDMVGN